MKIKSLLLGSAAASMLAVSAAQAADPIVYAEPEPMEYVRICDIYGAGFYYIPGTETCLRVGGYVRMQLDHTGTRDAYGSQGALLDSSYGSLVRAAPFLDARSETAWGTLRGYMSFEFDYTSATGAVDDEFSVPGDLGSGNSGGAVPHQAFIELGGLRMGLTDLLYARELGYGAGGVYGAVYGFGRDTEISYVFRMDGFTVGASVVENHDGTWAPDFQGVAKYDFGGNSIGGGFTYDNVNDRWTAKGVARFAIPNIGGSIGAHIFYSQGRGLVGSDFNRWAIVSPASGEIVDWSALLHASVPVTPELSVKGHVQWYNELALSDTWDFVAGLNWEPVPGFTVQPEIRYTTNSAQTRAALRFQRSF